MKTSSVSDPAYREGFAAGQQSQAPAPRRSLREIALSHAALFHQGTGVANTIVLETAEDFRLFLLDKKPPAK